ncbi:MAG: oxaloacetate decarboxylase, partial [Gammaproteobacteria bacterium]|nr:oxaloacetate decarboxylase [Gammaproteobacteria bacterium]
GEVESAIPAPQHNANPAASISAGQGTPVAAALAGNIFKIVSTPGDQGAEGDVVLILEAMKMETEVSAPRAGVVTAIHVQEGDAVLVGESLFDMR